MIAISQFQVPERELQGGACCCGQFTEIFFPNLDFEAGPSPAPGTFFTYSVGQNFGGWNVTRATIDHCDALVGNLGLGNPNGPSFFVDLHGSPGLGAISYDLYGLTPGNQYRIEFWTAQNGSGFSSDGNLKVANGAWLNVTWTVSVSGAVSWRKETYEFMAMGTTATMEFSSTGPLVYQGTLVDDIHIFECPGDSEAPEILNPQDDLLVECEKDVPKPPVLQVSDNCDVSPTVTFKEKTEILDPCTKKITRNWEVSDDCGNTTTAIQVIDVIDNNPPDFTRLPTSGIVQCDDDVSKKFNDWIKKNGNAQATDACGTVSWRTDYDRVPKLYCDTVLVEFIAKDHCGNETSEFSSFIVQDTVAPKFIIKAESKNLVCVPNTRDSLRNWLRAYGYSKVTTNCDTVMLSTNFDGDSTKNPLVVSFYAKDRCGNIDSCLATFSARSNSDTFRIIDYSCSFPENSMDTLKFDINGCDSIVILEKIRLPADSTYIKLNTCDPFQKSFDTTLLVNVSGCDSLIYREYVLQTIPVTTVQKSDCKILQYAKDTVVFQGQYCDSLIITEYFPLRKDSNSVFINTCDSNRVDTSVFILTNNAGCDSIVTVYTLYSPQQVNIVQQSVCGLIKSFTDTVSYVTGFCDSLVITMYTSLPLDTTYIQSASCDKTKTGTYSSRHTNRFGCDSLVIENIILIPGDSVFISKLTCFQNQSGIDIQSHKNKFGCDSIVTTVTLFIPSDTTYQRRTTCDPIQVRADTIKYVKGICDSLVIINYDFVPADTNYIRESTCNLQLAGKDTLLYSTALCDSVVIRQIDFISSDTLEVSKTSCHLNDVGIDTLILKNSKGCDSLIVVNTSYKPLRLEFSLDSINCYNFNDGIFRILNYGEFSNNFELHLNNANLGSQQFIDGLSPGFYEAYIRDQNGCVTDSIQFTLSNPVELIIDLGNDLDVKKGTSISLNLQSNKLLKNIYWYPVHLTNCITCYQVHFIAGQDTWVYVQGIDEQNCTRNDSVFIRVKKSGNIYAPNSFSPNGDNINDYFYLQGEDDAVIENLFIYNRWGEKVFETQDVPVNLPTAGWDGTFRSQKMNPGVFIFYARIRTGLQEIMELHGDLNLIR